MAKNKNSYHIRINLNKDTIDFEKIGARLNEEERKILIAHCFAPCFGFNHFAEAVNTPRNVTNAFRLGAYFNLVATEELLELYRKNAPVTESAGVLNTIKNTEETIKCGV